MKRTLFNWTLVLLSLCIAPETMNAENGDGPCGVKLSTNGTDITLRLTSEDWENNPFSSELNNTSVLNGYDLGNLRTLELKKGIYVGWASGNDYYNETSFKIKYCVYKDGEDAPEMTEYIALDHQAYREGNNYRFESTLANPIDLYALTNYEPGTYKLRMQMCEHKYWDNGTENGSWNEDKAEVEATFVVPNLYIAGDLPGIGWLENRRAISYNTPVTISIGNEGHYAFKIMDGQWGEGHEYYTVDRVNSSPHIYGSETNGSNINFSLSEAAEVTISISNETNKITITTTTPFTAPQYYIAGNGNSGDSWTINNENWDAKGSSMTNGSKTFYNLEASNNAYQFKITDGGWDNNNEYTLLDTEHCIGNVSGGNGSNIQFTLSKKSDVTINYDGKYITVQVDPVLYLTGNGLTADAWEQNTTWVPNARRLSYGSITIENLPASDKAYEFKVTTGAWPEAGTVWGFANLDAEHSTANVYEGDNHNICFLLNETSNITISFNPETSKIIFTSSTALRTPYNIVGAEALTGYNWGYDYDHHNLMSLQGDGTYKLEINNKELNSGTYNFKVIKNHKYAEGFEFPYGEGNNAWITISSQGKYNLVFTFIPDDATTVHCTAYELMDYTISQYGYNTFYYGKAYEIPEGVTAKIATNIDDNAITYEEIEDVIPANTGVLLIGTPNQTYTFLETTTDVTCSGNLFQGTLEDETISNSEVHYILSTHSGQVGMYWPHGTDEYGVGDFENKAHKAYLETSVLNAPARRGFPFNPQSELPTSVESGKSKVESGKFLRDGQLYIQRDGRIYNAQGVRVQ